MAVRLLPNRNMEEGSPLFNDGLRIPMDEESFIKREKQEYPLCACAREWLPLYIPALKGYVRQCPTCPMTASYCICDFTMPDPPQTPGHTF